MHFSIIGGKDKHKKCTTQFFSFIFDICKNEGEKFLTECVSGSKQRESGFSKLLLTCFYLKSSTVKPVFACMVVTVIFISTFIAGTF